jgi:hypothetical protein
MEDEMDDMPVPRTVSDLQTKDPIDVLARLDPERERLVPANYELKSGFEVAWELGHQAGRSEGGRRR